MPVTALKPVALGLAPSFGFGDRLGLATPGHLEALKREGGGNKGIRGIFAQQSIREMARTQRTPEQVMSAAAEALAAEGFTGKWGADADHLKTGDDVEATAEAGFVFFTIDPSDHVDQQADDYDPATLDEKFDAVKADVDWFATYAGKKIQVKNGPTIRFDAATVKRAAVKYGTAITRALRLATCIKQTARQRRQDYEIELSVDETPQPTTPAEHYIIADQLREHDVELVSLAPRFLGEFEKGVDFKGDPAALEASLRDHAAIARDLGPYKLSLHSGSDKLSMYGVFARATQGQFHVKTAGTSYLEAVRVAARHEPELFRRIIDFARERYETDRATYHVSANVAALPAPAELADTGTLEKLYLELWPEVPAGKGFTQPGRQVLHCTFGSVLTHAELGPALHQLLVEHAETYREVLADHFSRHLAALRSGM